MRNLRDLKISVSVLSFQADTSLQVAQAAGGWVFPSNRHLEIVIQPSWQSICPFAGFELIRVVLFLSTKARGYSLPCCLTRWEEEMEWYFSQGYLRESEPNELHRNSLPEGLTIILPVHSDVSFITYIYSFAFWVFPVFVDLLLQLP